MAIPKSQRSVIPAALSDPKVWLYRGGKGLLPLPVQWVEAGIRRVVVDYRGHDWIDPGRTVQDFLYTFDPSAAQPWKLNRGVEWRDCVSVVHRGRPPDDGLLAPWHRDDEWDLLLRNLTWRWFAALQQEQHPSGVFLDLEYYPVTQRRTTENPWFRKIITSDAVLIRRRAGQIALVADRLNIPFLGVLDTTMAWNANGAVYRNFVNELLRRASELGLKTGIAIGDLFTDPSQTQVKLAKVALRLASGIPVSNRPALQFGFSNPPIRDPLLTLRRPVLQQLVLNGKDVWIYSHQASYQPPRTATSPESDT